MASATPRKAPTKATPISAAVEVAQLRAEVASLTKRVEGLEATAAAQRRRQAAAVAEQLKQSPEKLAMLKEVLSLAEE